MSRDHLQVEASHLRVLLKEARAEISHLRDLLREREVVTVGGVGIEVERQETAMLKFKAGSTWVDPDGKVWKIVQARPRLPGGEKVKS